MGQDHCPLVQSMTSVVKLREIQSFSKIMDSCLKTARHHSQPDHYIRLSSDYHISEREGEPKSKRGSQRYVKESPPKDLKSLKINPFSSTKNMKGKVPRPRDKFCGQLMVSKPYRPILKKILDKYKRNFHPSNASQNRSACDEDREIKRKSRQMGETVRDELRYMSVLSKVISENNRREARLQRHNSIKLHQSLI